MKNQPRLETRLDALRRELEIVYAEMDAAGARWLELRAGNFERQKVEDRTNELITDSRRLERKIQTAEKRENAS